jgi:hypothetical protein
MAITTLSLISSITWPVVSPSISFTQSPGFISSSVLASGFTGSVLTVFFCSSTFQVIAQVAGSFLIGIAAFYFRYGILYQFIGIQDDVFSLLLASLINTFLFSSR